MQNRNKMIPLTQGKFTIVSVQDYDYLSQWKWCAHKRKSGVCYATRMSSRDGRSKRRTIYMHRVILARKLGRLDFLEVDHVDRNGLHNWRSNLRPTTHKQNQENKKLFKNNTSGIRCVSWNKRMKKYAVRVGNNMKRVFIGYFSSLEEAEAAAIEARNKFFTHHTD